MAGDWSVPSERRVSGGRSARGRERTEAAGRRRVKRRTGSALVVAVLLVALGCTSTDSMPTTTTTTTSVPPAIEEAEPVELDLPIAPVAVTVRVPEGKDAEVIGADADGVWQMRPAGARWTVGRHGATGAAPESFELPGSAYRPHIRAGSAGVVWVPGRAQSDPSIVEFGLVRIDLAARTASLVPTPAFVVDLHGDGETVWAVMEGPDDTDVVQGFTAAGPAGEPTTIAGVAEGELGAILTITKAAIYDCLAGAWGVTPHGGERIDVGAIGTGCNATPVGEHVLTTGDGQLLRLEPDGSRHQIRLDRAVGSCDGSRQEATVEVIILCGIASDGGSTNSGRIAVAVSPGSEEATVVGELESDPPIEVDDASEPAERAPGTAVGAVAERHHLARVRWVIATEAADGAVRWLVADPSVADRDLSWFDGVPWTSSITGEWSRIDTT